MIRRCLTRQRGFIAQLFHHHNLSVCLHTAGIVEQRNLALGLISSTEVPQQITALLANVHVPHTYTQISQREKESHTGSHRSKSSGGREINRLQFVIKLSLQLQQPPHRSANSPTFTHTNTDTRPDKL